VIVVERYRNLWRVVRVEGRGKAQSRTVLGTFNAKAKAEHEAAWARANDDEEER